MIDKGNAKLTPSIHFTILSSPQTSANSARIPVRRLESIIVMRTEYSNVDHQCKTNVIA